jgi:hypothetical protein
VKLVKKKRGRPRLSTKLEEELKLKLKLIQARVMQKPLLWVEVGKIACVLLVGICELRLSPPARYDPQCPSLLDFEDKQQLALILAFF